MNKALTGSIRLDRLLSNLGYGSRREIAEALKAGCLTINGDSHYKADASIALDTLRKSTVVFDQKPLDPLFPLTFMMNKPAGHTCSHKDSGPLVYDLLPSRWKRRKPALSTIGRLDKDSTGQLLFTDDGDLLHRITHPRTHALKYYSVTVKEPLKGDEKSLFGSGNFLLADENKPLKPAQWDQTGSNSGIMTLIEGRYRQIRRMFEALGNEVITLHRFQTGGLALGQLAEGAFRILTEDEIAQLLNKEEP